MNCILDERIVRLTQKKSQAFPSFSHNAKATLATIFEREEREDD